MKYLIKNFSDKVTAMFVYLVLAELVVALLLAIDCMIDYHFYAPDCDTYAMNEVYRVKTDEEFSKVETYLAQVLSGEKPDAFLQEYDSRVSNVVVVAADNNGRVLLE